MKNSPTGTPPCIYSIPEFCETHRFSRAHFYNLAARGEAPLTFKAGKRVLISEDSAREWRERQTLPAVR